MEKPDTLSNQKGYDAQCDLVFFIAFPLMPTNGIDYGETYHTFFKKII